MRFLKSTQRKAVVPLLLLSTAGWSQAIPDSTVLDWGRGSFPKEKTDEIYQLKLNGFYRFFSTHLLMDQPYGLDPNSGAVLDNRTLFIGDDSQLPNLWLNVSGRPTRKASWGFDLFMFQFMDGNVNSTYGSGQVAQTARPTVWDPLPGVRLGNNMSLNLGMNLYGSYLTEVGTFNVRMGGIHWYSMSDLTMATFQGYNRFTLTERNPWDPIGNRLGVRYQQMFQNGDVYQDTRWGERALQGIIVDGINLPGDLNVSAFFGKTELNGGFLTIPNNTYGGMITHMYNDEDVIKFNTINNTTWQDSLNEMQLGFNVHTFEWDANYEYFRAHVEAGIGRFRRDGEDYPWGEAINAKITTKRNVLPIPIEVQYYRVSPYVVNNNAIFWNASFAEFQNVNQTSVSTQGSAVLTPFASSVTMLGQMTNNRTGVNLNTAFKVGDFNIGLGYGISREIQAIQSRVTFSHFVNQLTRSRFWRWTFPSNVGPYGNYSKVYRDAFQLVNLTDDSLGVTVTPKYFNQFEVHAKYRTKLAYRNFYAFFLGRYYTVQPEFSFLPQFNGEPYLRLYSSELEMFYELSESFIINSYLGYERNIGNYDTELNGNTLRPLNQNGWGVGVGFDVSLGSNAGLFFRHRWFSFEDTSFELDAFSGQESSLELKVFF
ncbi:MAG: hypothetical protein HWD92_07005 [Flavobacteriia bacterium]|nr:hypothetical protein [Flavobacteriia bacterium]